MDAVTTKYCYDGDQVIAEYDYNDVSTEYDLARKFIYGPGIDEPICMIDVVNNDTVYYYHFDGLGSVVALSDDNGNIVEQYSYDVFGEPNRVSSVGNPYFFTGRRLDTETDNYYYRARYYKPEIGRFLQADPIGYTVGLNLYTYCGNNPLNWLDPYGLFEFKPGQFFKGVGQVIIGGVAVGTCGITAVANPLLGLGQAVAGMSAFSFGIGNLVGAFADDAPTLPSSVPGAVGMAIEGGDTGAAAGDLVTDTVTLNYVGVALDVADIVVNETVERLEELTEEPREGPERPTSQKESDKK